MEKQREYLKTYLEVLKKRGMNLTAEEKSAKYYVENDKELREIYNTINNLTNDDARLKAIDTFFEEKEKKLKEADKVKEAISKMYGVNVDKIDFMKLESGIDIIAFYDEKESRKRVIDYSYAKSIVEEFSNIQNQNVEFQSQDYDKNSIDIAKKEAEVNDGKRELEMIDIERLKSEYDELIKRVDDPVKKQNIKKIIDESEIRNIKYVNLENMVGLDEDNNIVESYYDDKNNKSIIESPVNYKPTVEYVDNKENVENEVFNEEPADEYGSQTTGEISDDESINITPTDFEKEEMVVSAEEINLDSEMTTCHIAGDRIEIMNNIKSYTADMSKLDSDYNNGKLSQDEFDFYELMTTKYANVLKNKMTRVLKLQNNNMGNSGFVNLIFVSILLMFLAFIFFIF